MRTIIGYFKDFYRTSFSLSTYLWSLLFIAVLIVLNYVFHVESKLLHHCKDPWSQFLLYFVIFSVSYYGIIVIQSLTSVKKTKLTGKFWSKSLIAMILLSVHHSWYPGYNTICRLVHHDTARYIFKFSYHFSSVVFILIPLVILKYKFDRQSGDGLYGLKFRNLDLKPFWIMLLCMIPLLYIASQFPDVRHSILLINERMVQPLRHIIRFQR